MTEISLDSLGKGLGTLVEIKKKADIKQHISLHELQAISKYQRTDDAAAGQNSVWCVLEDMST